MRTFISLFVQLSNVTSVPTVLQRIRRARRTHAREASISRFAEYRDVYRETLSTVETLAGEEAVAAVGEWTVEWVDSNHSLPDPDTFRTNARRVLVERGVDPDAEASRIEG